MSSIIIFLDVRIVEFEKNCSLLFRKLLIYILVEGFGIKISGKSKKYNDIKMSAVANKPNHLFDTSLDIDL